MPDRPKYGLTRPPFSLLRRSPPIASFPIPCNEARVLGSARLDGETTPAENAQFDEHLQACEDCKHFLFHAEALERSTRLVPLDSIPDLSPTLISHLHEQRPAGRIAGGTPTRWSRALRPLNRTVRWATVILPLGLAVPALSVGAFTTVHITPSNAKSPCTARVERAFVRHDIRHGTPSFVLRTAPR